MPRYRYNKLFVTALEPRHFDPVVPGALRMAVEHLRSIPQGKHVGIVAESLVRAGGFKIQAPAMLYLDQIEGKTPREVWDMLDSLIDRQVEYFSRR